MTPTRHSLSNRAFHALLQVAADPAFFTIFAHVDISRFPKAFDPLGGHFNLSRFLERVDRRRPRREITGRVKSTEEIGISARAQPLPRERYHNHKASVKHASIPRHMILFGPEKRRTRRRERTLACQRGRSKMDEAFEKRQRRGHARDRERESRGRDPVARGRRKKKSKDTQTACH